MDWSTLTPWIVVSLNASRVEELVDWTEAELYQYAEESFHALGRGLLLIVQYDDSTALVANQGLYPVPALHIVTIYAAADGVTLQPAEVDEVEALDDDYEEAAGVAAPTRWIGNASGLNYLRVYPPKNAAGVLTLIFQMRPPDMPVPATGQPLELKMPAPIGDYLAAKALEKARRRQGDGQMLDAAQAFSTLGQIFERAAAAYWGSGS
ncbi:MAG: hypothetical protein LAP40_16965 [Acidobacteriia bacterium]|nr:hypothetical protein [Terriglobia bacterium]